MSWDTVGSLMGGVGAIAAVVVAFVQLRNLNKTLVASNLMATFNIEFELNKRKTRLADIRKENVDVLSKFPVRSKWQDEHQVMFDSLEGRRKEALEDYYNIFDRLCYFILRGQLNEEDFRLDFRQMLSDTIRGDAENNFGNGTRFRNMLKLDNRWKDK